MICSKWGSFVFIQAIMLSKTDSDEDRVWRLFFSEQNVPLYRAYTFLVLLEVNFYTTNKFISVIMTVFLAILCFICHNLVLYFLPVIIKWNIVCYPKREASYFKYFLFEILRYTWMMAFLSTNFFPLLKLYRNLWISQYNHEPSFPNTTDIAIDEFSIQ